jgi:hypothetical protein
MFDVQRVFRILALTTLALTPFGPTFADPMRPDNAVPTPETSRAPSPEPSFSLTSIYRLDQRAYAVINGRWLRVNDTLNAYELVAIGNNQVTLQRGNRTRTLTLQQAGSLAITPIDEE